jgi:hypothetical protein
VEGIVRLWTTQRGEHRAVASANIHTREIQMLPKICEHGRMAAYSVLPSRRPSLRTSSQIAQHGGWSGCEWSAEAADRIRPLIVSMDIILSFSLVSCVDLDLVLSSAFV